MTHRNHEWDGWEAIDPEICAFRNPPHLNEALIRDMKNTILTLKFMLQTEPEIPVLRLEPNAVPYTPADE